LLFWLSNAIEQKEEGFFMSEDRDPHKAVNYILKYAALFAKAKAERTYIEQYRKSLKGILMKRSMETAIGAQEREAYAHPEMVELLMGLKAAVEIEEKLKWDITAAELRVEIWRTEQANNRAEGRATL
jgi:hypothetical protein